MGIYTTTKCAHCNTTWQLFEYGSDSACGSPIVKCRSCGGMNVTKRDLFRNFDLGDKIDFFVTEIIFGIGFGVAALVAGGYFFNTFFIEQNYFDFSLSKNPWYWILIGKLFILFVCFGSLHLGFRVIYNKLTIYRQIYQMEKMYDKQGGFLWSDQQY